jgi:hypothetical protein
MDRFEPKVYALYHSRFQKVSATCTVTLGQSTLERKLQGYNYLLHKGTWTPTVPTSQAFLVSCPFPVLPGQCSP